MNEQHRYSQSCRTQLSRNIRSDPEASLIWSSQQNNECMIHCSAATTTRRNVPNQIECVFRSITKRLHAGHFAVAALPKNKYPTITILLTITVRMQDEKRWVNDRRKHANDEHSALAISPEWPYCQFNHAQCNMKTLPIQSFVSINCFGRWN